MRKAKKYPTLSVSSKDPKKPPVGSNLKVTLDGKPIPFCSSVTFEAQARGVNKITLELYGHAEIQAMGEVTTTVVPLTPKGGSRA